MLGDGKVTGTHRTVKTSLAPIRTPR